MEVECRHGEIEVELVFSPDHGGLIGLEVEDEEGEEDEREENEGDEDEEKGEDLEG